MIARAAANRIWPANGPVLGDVLCAISGQGSASEETCGIVFGNTERLLFVLWYRLVPGARKLWLSTHGKHFFGKARHAKSILTRIVPNVRPSSVGLPNWPEGLNHVVIPGSGLAAFS